MHVLFNVWNILLYHILDKMLGYMYKKDANLLY